MTTVKDQAIEFIEEQIAHGETYGAFDILDDETGKYVFVDWSLKIEIDDEEVK